MYILGYAILTLVYIVNINNKNHRAGHLFMTPEFFHGCVIVLRPHLETVPYVNVPFQVKPRAVKRLNSSYTPRFYFIIYKYYIKVQSFLCSVPKTEGDPIFLKRGPKGDPFSPKKET